MHDECWRRLIAAEGKGEYTRVALLWSKLSDDDLEKWVDGVGIYLFYQIDEGSRKYCDIKPLVVGGKVITKHYYLFHAKEHRSCYHSRIGHYLFVWFSHKPDAVMFKTTFGGDS